MHEHKQLPVEFLKNLYHFITIALLVFLAVSIFSSLYLIFEDPNQLGFRVPRIVHYLGLGVSLLMLSMGLYYTHKLHKIKS